MLAHQCNVKDVRVFQGCILDLGLGGGEIELPRIFGGGGGNAICEGKCMETGGGGYR